MKPHKKAAITGIILSLGFLVHAVYHAIRISKDLPFYESLLPEIVNAIIIFIILLIPAIILIYKKNLKERKNWVYWMYPLIIGLGLLNVLFAGDPLTAGLPMILFVLPFSIIYSVYLLFFKRS